MNYNEKYRALTLDGIRGQDGIVAELKAIVANVHRYISDGDWPHMYFYGKHGTGKTNTTTAMLRSAFGDAWETNFREFNASETKIDDIRTEVVDLASNQVIGTYTAPNGEMYDLPLNFIFFDEIDWLGDKSQAMLRRLMEKHAATTRFILSCNYHHKVIGALKSRCMRFHFRPLEPNAIKQILSPIIKTEKIKVETDALDLIANHCGGDAREAQNILQKAALLGNVDRDRAELCIEEILAKFNTKLLAMAIRANNKNDDNYIKDFKMLDSHLEKLYYGNGYTGSQIVNNIFDSVTADSKMPIPIKRKLLSSIGGCMRDCALVDDDLYAVKMWLRSVN